MNTLDDTALAAYRKVVNRAPDGAQRQDLIDEAEGILRAEYDKGLLDLDVSEALRSALTKADLKDKDATDSMIERLRAGIDPLELTDDPSLRMVVTLGKGRRKSWEYITVEDLDDMDELRRGNMQSVVAAYRNWQEAVAIISPAIELYGTVGAAVRAGAFTNSRVAA